MFTNSIKTKIMKQLIFKLSNDISAESASNYVCQEIKSELKRLNKSTYLKFSKNVDVKVGTIDNDFRRNLYTLVLTFNKIKPTLHLKKLEKFYLKHKKYELNV